MKPILSRLVCGALAAVVSLAALQGLASYGHGSRDDAHAARAAARAVAVAPATGLEVR